MDETVRPATRQAWLFPYATKNCHATAQVPGSEILDTPT